MKNQVSQMYNVFCQNNIHCIETHFAKQPSVDILRKST